MAEPLLGLIPKKLPLQDPRWVEFQAPGRGPKDMVMAGLAVVGVFAIGYQYMAYKVTHALFEPAFWIALVALAAAVALAFVQRRVILDGHRGAVLFIWYFPEWPGRRTKGRKVAEQVLNLQGFSDVKVERVRVPASMSTVREFFQVRMTGEYARSLDMQHFSNLNRAREFAAELAACFQLPVNDSTRAERPKPERPVAHAPAAVSVEARPGEATGAAVHVGPQGVSVSLAARENPQQAEGADALPAPAALPAGQFAEIPEASANAEPIRAAGEAPPANDLLNPGKRAYVTLSLLGLNAACFLIMFLVLGPSPKTMEYLAWGANFGPSTCLDGQYWRLLTSMFIHFGMLHIACNMLALWDLGRLAEFIFGRPRFLAVYLLGGLGGSVISMWWQPLSVCAGASGAIFAIIGGLIAYFSMNQDPQMAEVAKQKARSLLVMVGYNIAYGVMTPGISNAAHLGGLAAGWLLGFALLPGKKKSVLETLRIAGGVALFLAITGAVLWNCDGRIRRDPKMVALRAATAMREYLLSVKPLIEDQDRIVSQIRAALDAPGHEEPAAEVKQDVLRQAGEDLKRFSELPNPEDAEVLKMHGILKKHFENLAEAAREFAQPHDHWDRTTIVVCMSNIESIAKELKPILEMK